MPAWTKRCATPCRTRRRGRAICGRISRPGFFEPPPHNEVLGPIRPRGGPNGLILRGGSVVARWGDTRQVDFTFSVAKSYLSLLAGIAVADGLIVELDEPVARTVARRRVRRPAQRRHHLAASVAADLGVGRHAVRQVGHRRSQSQPRVGGEGAQGRCAAVARAGHLLGIQRRAGEPAGAGAAAPLPPTAARGVRRTHHASDRRVERLDAGTAIAHRWWRSTGG